MRRLAGGLADLSLAHPARDPLVDVMVVHGALTGRVRGHPRQKRGWIEPPVAAGNSMESRTNERVPVEIPLPIVLSSVG
jgi:hypothetical protein